MKPVIKSMQEWLKTCPLVASAQDEGVAFRVSWLSPDVDEYSIEDVPTQPILAKRLNGTIRQRCLPCPHARSTTPTWSIRPNVPASGMT